jgi:hypothetical protein
MRVAATVIVFALLAGTVTGVFLIVRTALRRGRRG